MGFIWLSESGFYLKLPCLSVPCARPILALQPSHLNRFTKQCYRCWNVHRPIREPLLLVLTRSNTTREVLKLKLETSRTKSVIEAVALLERVLRIQLRSVILFSKYSSHSSLYLKTSQTNNLIGTHDRNKRGAWRALNYQRRSAQVMYKGASCSSM